MIRRLMIRRFWERQDGQGLVEFAIILPVLLILIFGIVEFSLLLYNQHVITNASREGARYGIVARAPRRSLAEIQAVVDNYCGNHLITFGGGTPTTVIEPDPTAGAVFGDDLTVRVTFRYDFLVVPGFIAGLAGNIDLRAHTTMKYE